MVCTQLLRTIQNPSLRVPQGGQAASDSSSWRFIGRIVQAHNNNFRNEKGSLQTLSSYERMMRNIIRKPAKNQNEMSVKPGLWSYGSLGYVWANRRELRLMGQKSPKHIVWNLPTKWEHAALPL